MVSARSSTSSSAPVFARTPRCSSRATTARRARHATGSTDAPSRTTVVGPARSRGTSSRSSRAASVHPRSSPGRSACVPAATCSSSAARWTSSRRSCARPEAIRASTSWTASTSSRCLPKARLHPMGRCSGRWAARPRSAAGSGSSCSMASSSSRTVPDDPSANRRMTSSSRTLMPIPARRATCVTSALRSCASCAWPPRGGAWGSRNAGSVSGNRAWKLSVSPRMSKDSSSPNPDSFFTYRGRTVELKVHRCLWSGRYSENSPLAIEECGRENVLRTEIDLQLLRDGEFVVFHDDRFDRVTDARGLVREASASEAKRASFRDGTRPLLFAEAVELIAAYEYPRCLELDLKDLAPYGSPQIEALVRTVQPIKARAHFSCPADWNLRRILTVDRTLQVSLNPHSYIDSANDDELALPMGAYGYRDAHPLARRRFTTTAEYLRDRLGGGMG